MKKGLSILAVIILIASAFSCNSKKNELKLDNQYNHSQGKLKDTITLKQGDSVVFGQQHFKILFNKIIDDSRCPKGAVCIWAGAAEGEFKFKSDSNDKLFTLGTAGNPTAPNSYLIDRYIIKLVDYLPYPDIDQKSPGIHSAKIIVSQQP